MDALNLAQKVYNMLNRIAVSGGTYRDWLETVFTGGEYMERCETPIFEGGVSQEIVFQEVISNSATEQEKANFIFIGSQNLRYRRWKAKDIGAWTGSQLKIEGLEATSTYSLDAIHNGLSVGLQQWELASLDTLRDNILTTKGNVTFKIGRASCRERV